MVSTFTAIAAGVAAVVVAMLLHVVMWVRSSRRFKVASRGSEWVAARDYSVVLRVASFVHDYLLDVFGVDLMSFDVVVAPPGDADRAAECQVIQAVGVDPPPPGALHDADIAAMCLRHDCVVDPRTRRRFGAMGRYLIKNFIVGRHGENRLHIARYFAANQDACTRVRGVERPLCILGPNRSGTTLLFSMLSRDPAARALRQWEQMMPFDGPTPPEALSANLTHPRVKEAEKLTDAIRELVPTYPEKLRAMHYYEAREIEEEVLVMANCHVQQAHACLLGTDSVYWRWLLRRRGKEQIYAHLRASIQALCRDTAPESHVLLKAPLHSLYPQQFAQVFPGARLVVTERAPERAVASYAKLMYICVMHYMDYDRASYEQGRPRMELIGRAALRQQAVMAARLEVALRPGGALADHDIVRVRFEDLVADPIREANRISVELFGTESSAAAIDGFRAYLDANPKGKHGSVTYSLEEFGLTPQDVANEYDRALREEEAKPGHLGETDTELLAMMNGGR